MREGLTDGTGSWLLGRRPGKDALAIAAFSVAAAALGFSDIWDLFSLLPAGLSPWLTLITAVPACLLVLMKRRAPMLSLLGAAIVFVIDMLTFGGLGPLIVLLDVLWMAAFLGTPRVRSRILGAIAAATVVLFICTLLRTDASVTAAFLIALQFGAFAGTDYWWAVAVSQAHELAELHRQRAEDAAETAERERAEAIRRERESMARELHDVVAGHVMAMAIRAEAAMSNDPDEQADRSALRAVRDAGLDAHGALRSMISVLRRGADGASALPRWADLPGIVEDAERAGLRVRFERADVGSLDVATEQTVVRVVRESLSNCIRHASGALVDIAIEGEQGGVRVRVASRGGATYTTIDDSGGGWGLQMIGERVQALGGELTAGPQGDGWLVDAHLPARAGS